MNKYLLLVILYALAFILPTAAHAEQAHVLSVIDGDTIVVKINNKIEHIRVVGIDTPELHDKQSGVAQCYSKEARNEVVYLLDRKKVQLDRDPLTHNRDAYGRYLRMVHIDRVSLDMHLIQKGFARVYTRSPATNIDKLLALQQIAQKNKKGLWKFCKK